MQQANTNSAKNSPKPPKLIFSIPKSASTNVARVLGLINLELNGAGNGRPSNFIGGNGKVVNQMLCWSMFDELTKGEIVNSHTSPEGYNRYILENLSNVRYLILTRDPRDQIAAIFCHLLKDKNIALRKFDAFGAIGDLSASDVDEGIRHLLEDGYLQRTLIWLEGWLSWRHKERSAVLSYEEFHSDRLGAIDNAAIFFFGRPIPEHMKDSLTAELQKKGHAESQVDMRPEIYPRGYTAGEGIWRSYFSESNTSRFQKIAGAMLTERSALLEHYPNLLDR